MTGGLTERKTERQKERQKEGKVDRWPDGKKDRMTGQGTKADDGRKKDRTTVEQMNKRTE